MQNIIPTFIQKGIPIVCIHEFSKNDILISNYNYIKDYNMIQETEVAFPFPLTYLGRKLSNKRMEDTISLM